MAAVHGGNDWRFTVGLGFLDRTSVHARCVTRLAALPDVSCRVHEKKPLWVELVFWRAMQMNFDRYHK